MIVELTRIDEKPLYVFIGHIVAITNNDVKGRTSIYTDDSDPFPFVVKDDIAIVLSKIRGAMEPPKGAEYDALKSE